MNKMISKQTLLTVDGKLLTQARINANLSMVEAAEKIGSINKSTISRWEQEVLSPSPERLWKMVELYATNKFIRLNDEAILTPEDIEALRKIGGEGIFKMKLDKNKRMRNADVKRIHELLGDEYFVRRLNRSYALTDEEIEVVRKLREG